VIRQYAKKRSIRASADRIVRQSAETKDAVLWDVIPSQRICRVKVQGSDKLIQARYPEHWHKEPEWLKPGNAVKILHTGGNRTSVEIIGCGIAIPTPAPGSQVEPPKQMGQNTILSGCGIFAIGSGMDVYVAVGTYRINDVIYSVTSDLVMGVDPPLLMGVEPALLMGKVAGSFTLQSADSTMFRMDAFFIGVDGTIDYVVGTPSATNPLIPETPLNHVLIGWVLVPPTTTLIDQSLVNASFVQPFPTQLTATVADNQLTWLQTSTTITVAVLDQYGRKIVGTNWQINAILTNGTGTITSSMTTGTSSNIAVFTYRRLSPQAGENCPVFIQFTLMQDSDIMQLTAILLEDINGAILFG